jgi:hypothetical protein
MVLRLPMVVQYILVHLAEPGLVAVAVVDLHLVLVEQVVLVT